MKGQINHAGALLIKRGEKLEEQLCPFAYIRFGEDVVDQLMYCGDWCPLFGEPEYQASSDYYYENLEKRQEVPKSAKLQLCKKKLQFDNFVDSRSFIDVIDS